MKLRWQIALVAIGLCSLIRTSPSQTTQDDFEVLAKSAAGARESGHSTDAIGDYRQALALRADWEEGWWYLAVLEYDSDHFADADTAFEKVLAIDPNNGAAKNFIGLCEFETGSYEKSFQHLQEGQVQGTGDDADLARIAKYHLALLFNRNGDFDRARKMIIEAFPDKLPAQARISLGLSLLRVPLLPIEVDPSYDALIQGAGEAETQTVQGNSEQARIALLELIKAYPATPYLHYAYGKTLAANFRNEDALREQRLEQTISPTSPLPQIEISRLLLIMKHAREALSAAERAVQLAPASADAHRGLAESLKATGSKAPAAKELSIATTMGPGLSSRETRLVELYSIHSATSLKGGDETSAPDAQFAALVQQAQKAKAIGDIETAIRLDQQAVALRRDWDDGRWELAMVCYTAKRFSDSASVLREFVVRKPQDGTAWAVLGLSEFEMKDYDNALIHLRRGKKLGFGGSAESLDLANYRLGLLLNRSREFDYAATILGAQSKTLDKQAKLALGLAFLRIALLPEQLSLEQQDLAQHVGDIAALLQNSRYDKALPDLKALLQKNPAAAFLHYAYAGALESLSQYDEAEAQFLEETKLSPTSSLPYVHLARISLRTHHLDKALQYASHAVELAPQAYPPHYVLGRSYLELDQVDFATRELETAKRLEPQSPEVRFSLAKAYSKQNQPEKERLELEAFDKLNAAANNQRTTHGNQSYGAIPVSDGLAASGLSDSPPQ
jgi:tetratricopeptide (TPR) repeat protein